MRALYLVVIVTLCLPLQAGDPADLTKAVEMFRSPHPAVRAEGSRIADQELRKLLAPFINALQDPDPEVRRRVREAILALVPFRNGESETQKGHAHRRARIAPRLQPFQKRNLQEDIRAALKRVAEGDPNKDVREEAKTALARLQKGG